MGQRAYIVSVAGEVFRLRSARLVCLHTAVARKNVLLSVFIRFYNKFSRGTATHTQQFVLSVTSRGVTCAMLS